MNFSIILDHPARLKEVSSFRESPDIEKRRGEMEWCQHAWSLSPQLPRKVGMGGKFCHGAPKVSAKSFRFLSCLYTWTFPFVSTKR